MADIRYVILSDLHFGATNSVLTALCPDGAGGWRADPARPTPLLEGLVAGLGQLGAAQQQRPTLILAGDVLDLALSPDQVASAAFEHFVDLAFSPPGRMFAPTVYYLPGNHDHHLWETAREAQYVAALRANGEEPPRPPWHVTRLVMARQPPAVTTELLSALIQRRPGCSDVTVQVAYPNLALTSAGSERCLVVSHGHFTESIYTLMSRLKDILFPDQAVPGPRSVATLEEENFAWIDFFWSTLGRSGQVGADLSVVYADLTDAPALDVLAANLIGGLLARGNGPEWLHPVEGFLLKALFKREVNRVSRSERGNPDQTLSPAGRDGLRSYLAGPVLAQLRDELGPLPPEVGFVWGHTHKPYAEAFPVEGYRAPVSVYNTGGWVVDTAVAATAQGGSAVLVDDDLNCASVSVYRQTASGEPSPLGVDAGPAGGELARSLAADIAASEPWRSLPAIAAGIVAERHRVQADNIAAASTRQRQRATTGPAPAGGQ